MYQATAKYIRMSPRKMRLVADSVRSMDAHEAMQYLTIHPKKASEPIKRVIESAVANAVVKNAKADDLTIHALEVMKGPVMKRWRAVSRGRAHKYKKYMSHVKVVLTEKNQNIKDQTKKNDSKEVSTKNKNT